VGVNRSLTGRYRRFRNRVTARVGQTPDIASLQADGLRIGHNVKVGRGAILDPQHCWLIDIEDDVLIAFGVTILAHDASTKRLMGYTRVARTRIRHKAYLGARSVILAGVTVGERAVVGAGSVVRQDVPPDTMVAGNPARAIGGSEEYRKRHLDLIDRRPRYEGLGWTYGGGITMAQREQMRRDLADGEGYIV
jgi:maltose O-acetyltransferase